MTGVVTFLGNNVIYDFDRKKEISAQTANILASLIILEKLSKNKSISLQN